MQRLKKKENIFMLMLIFFSAALFVKSYGQGMSVTNTTALAVSYRNGYAENALLGTICQIIFSFLGIARPDYAHVILFAKSEEHNYELQSRKFIYYVVFKF